MLARGALLMVEFGTDVAEFVISAYLRAAGRGETHLPEWHSVFTQEEMAELGTLTWHDDPFVSGCQVALMGDRSFVYAMGDQLYRWRQGSYPFVTIEVTESMLGKMRLSDAR